MKNKSILTILFFMGFLFMSAIGLHAADFTAIEAAMDAETTSIVAAAPGGISKGLTIFAILFGLAVIKKGFRIGAR